MTRYQMVTLALAVAVAACLVGTGISLAERSFAGMAICLLAAALLMGAGFRYKKKHAASSPASLSAHKQTVDVKQRGRE